MTPLSDRQLHLEEYEGVKRVQFGAFDERLEPNDALALTELVYLSGRDQSDTTLFVRCSARQVGTLRRTLEDSFGLASSVEDNRHGLSRMTGFGDVRLLISGVAKDKLPAVLQACWGGGGDDLWNI